MNSISVLTVLMVLFSIAFPVSLAWIWKKKTQVSIKPFIVGAIMWVVFVMLLERLLHMVCLVMDNPVSAAIKNSPWLYCLYGGFAAGLFEETARYLSFRFILKRHTGKDNAIAYGIGHGGIEVFLIVGLTYIMYILTSMGVSFGSPEVDAQMAQALGQITPSTVLIGGFERISAMMTHIGLSIIVWRSIYENGKKWLFPLAILIHALVDIPAVLYQYRVIDLWTVEIWAFILGLMVLIYGVRRLYSGKQASIR